MQKAYDNSVTAYGTYNSIYANIHIYIPNVAEWVAESICGVHDFIQSVCVLDGTVLAHTHIHTGQNDTICNTVCVPKHRTTDGI